MKTLLLMSILIATVAIPDLAARQPAAPRGLGAMVLGFALFVVAYYLWVAYGHTAFFVPQR